MAARGEIDLDEYGDDAEPEFESEEAYIDYYVAQKMKELRA